LETRELEGIEDQLDQQDNLETLVLMVSLGPRDLKDQLVWLGLLDNKELPVILGKRALSEDLDKLDPRVRREHRAVWERTVSKVSLERPVRQEQPVHPGT